MATMPPPAQPWGTVVTNPVGWQKYQADVAAWSRQQIAQQQAQQAIQPRVPYAPAAPTPQQIQQLQSGTYTNTVKLQTGELVSLNDYAGLTPTQQQILMQQGIDKFNEQQQVSIAREQQRISVSRLGYKGIVESKSIPATQKERLIKEHYPGAPILTSKREYTERLAEAMESPEYKRGGKLPFYFEEKRQEVIRTGWGTRPMIIAAEVIVPGLYVGRNWKSLSASEKAFAITLDVISLAGVPGATVRGARAVSTPGRVARISGAAKGGARELLLPIRLPVDVVASPIQTTKGAVTSIKATGKSTLSLAENIASPRKIPEAVITTTNGTIRLPVKYATSQKQAMKIRDILTDLYRKGETPVIEAGNMRYELSRSPLMKRTGGGLVHSTPQSEKIYTSGRVEFKPGKPEREQGLFLSTEPLPRFTTTSAYGAKGKQSAIIIFSKETAEKAVPTGKLYRGAAEIERKFPVGMKIPMPKQRLYTRVGPLGNRVEIWLEKPLSKMDIAKLKAEGLIEAIKTPFKPAITVKKLRGIRGSEIDDLADILKNSDAELAIRSREALRAAESGRYVPAALARSYTGTRQRRVVDTGRKREDIAGRKIKRAGDRGVERKPEDIKETERERPSEERRETPREPDRIPPRDTDRMTDRTPGREQPRESERVSTRLITKKTNGKQKGVIPSTKLQVESVEGVPHDPAVVSWNDGIVRISVKPPYRQGTRDIEYKRLKEAEKGRGSQEDTLKITEGDAPEKLTLRQGFNRISISAGKHMSHYRLKSPHIHLQRRGTLIGGGKSRRQHRGMLIR